MFVVGEEDDLITPHVIDLASGDIAGSVVVRVPGAGHSVYFEQPEVFNFQVLRLIREANAREA